MPILTVGNGGTYPYIQDAIDAIGGLAAPSSTDRYTIQVAPGRYEEQVTDNWSYVDVIADVPGTAVVINLDDENAGGTYRIAVDPAEPVVDKIVSGLRIIRNASRFDSANDESEAALYVGGPMTEGFPAVAHWDGIIIKDCMIEGARNGVVCLGIGAPPGLGEPEAPRTPEVGMVQLLNNVIRSAHDGMTMKGNMRFISKSNHVRINSGGIDPYITEAESWKCAGFHVNVNDEVGPAMNSNSFFHSSHDSVWITAGPKSGDVDDQKVVAGYLFNNLREGDPEVEWQVLHRCEIVSPHVLVDFQYPGEDLPDLIAGVAAIGLRMTIHLDGLVIVGGSIHVRQLADAASVPAYGVILDADSEQTPLRIVGTRIKVENANALADAIALATRGVEDRIEADVYSDEDIQQPSGLIVAVDHQPPP